MTIRNFFCIGLTISAGWLASLALHAQTDFAYDATGNLVAQAASTTTGAPVLLSEASTQLGQVGGSIGFSINASGAGNLTYQWYKNGSGLPGKGTAIAGATGNTLLLSNVAASAFTDGITGTNSYYVVVSNGSGSAASSPFFAYLDSQGNGVPDWMEVPYARATNPMLSASSSPASVEEAVVQADGKVLVSGAFKVLAGRAQPGFGRLNADGSNDGTFTSGIAIRYVIDFLCQADGKILLVGGIGEEGLERMVRLNTDGSVDSTFTAYSDSSLSSVGLQPDGKIFIAGVSGFFRLNLDSSLDTTFNPGTNLEGGAYVSRNCIQVDSTGKIYLAGAFQGYNGASSPGLVRILSTGVRDATFKVGTGFFGTPAALQVRASGGVVVAGPFSNYAGKSVPTLIVIGATGTRDTTSTLAKSFVPYANSNFTLLTTLPDGSLLAGGSLYDASFNSMPLLHLTTAGVADNAYKVSGNPNPPRTVALEADGKIIVGGDTKLYRMNPDGSTDSTRMAATSEGAVYRLVERTDGKILVQGAFEGLANSAKKNLGLLNADGSLDDAFSADNIGSTTYDIVAAPGGKFYLLYDTLRRYNPDGSLDDTFNAASPSGARSYAGSIATHADGRILAAVYGNGGYGLIRLSEEGAEETSLVVNCDNSITKILTLPDGKIIIAGHFTKVNGKARATIARLLPNGALDTSFAPPTPNAIPEALALLPNGQLVLGGAFSLIGAAQHPVLARLNTDGSLDGGWKPLTAGQVNSLSVQPEGSLVVVGSFDLQVGLVSYRSAVRFLSNGKLDVDFNPGLDSEVYAAMTRSNGDIYLGGSFFRSNDGLAAGLIRYGTISQVSPRPVTYTPTGVLKAGSPLTLSAVVTSSPGTISSVTFQVSTDNVNYLPIAAGIKRTSTTWTANWVPNLTGNYYLRSAVKNSLGVSGVSLAVLHQDGQVITFPAVGAVTYGDPSVTLKATSSSGLPISYKIISGFGYVSGDQLSPYQPGPLVVQASQAGSFLFAPAESVTQTITVNKAPQTITFGPLPNRPSGADPFQLTATASSSLPVTYTVTGKATVSPDGLLTMTGTGVVKIVASQPGDDYTQAAPPITQSFTVLAPTTYAQWQTKYGITGSAKLAPYGDGVPNLLKYLFAIDPTRPMTAADRAALPKMSVVYNEYGAEYGSRHLVLTYQKFGFSTGLTTNVQISNDLRSWTTITPSPLKNLSFDLVTGNSIVEARIDSSVHYTNLFVRLNFTGTLSGQGALSVSTVPEGFIRHSVPAQSSGVSKSYVTIPLTREPVYIGKVASLTATTISVATPAPWTAGAFATAAQPYFVKILTGTETGRVMKVTSNTTTALTLDTTDNTTQTVPLNTTGFAVAAGDSFEIFAGDTLASVLGKNTVESPLWVVGGTTAAASTGVGVYKASTATWTLYYFDTAKAYWRSTTSSANADGTPVYPYTPLEINVAAGEYDFDLFFYGRVTPVPHLIKTTGSGKVVFDSTGYPVDVYLSEFSLGPNWTHANTSSSADLIKQWAAYDNVNLTYFQKDDLLWWSDLYPYFDQGDIQLQAGSEISLLKRAAVSGATSFLKVPMPYSVE